MAAVIVSSGRKLSSVHRSGQPHPIFSGLGAAKKRFTCPISTPITIKALLRMTDNKGANASSRRS